MILIRALLVAAAAAAASMFVVFTLFSTHIMILVKSGQIENVLRVCPQLLVVLLCLNQENFFFRQFSYSFVFELILHFDMSRTTGRKLVVLAELIIHSKPVTPQEKTDMVDSPWKYQPQLVVPSMPMTNRLIRPSSTQDCCV
jgi:hypothetical protein